MTANIFDAFLAGNANQLHLHIYMLCCLLVFFHFLFLKRMSHSKAFSLQSKPGRNSHSSNRYVCVVFAHRGMRRNKGQQVWFFFQRCLSFPPNLHIILGPSYLPHRGPGRWGDGRIPAGLTQSPLMEPEVERPCTQQQNLKITT